MNAPEYHKIETLYERDEKTHRLVQPLVFKNRIYQYVDPWVWTEKIDGTNIRVSWQDGGIAFGGRTDNAQLPADLLMHLIDKFTPDAFEDVFPDSNNVVLYGEGYGAGIQKGGGDYRPDKGFILFDVLVRGEHNDWWLSYENVADIASKLDVPVVPCFGQLTLADATQFVKEGFQSVLNNGVKQAEGLVGRPIETLYDKKGARLIVKLKTKDF
jgi:ATP-dependent RNA circularization protein (DNA/RNA ligase family)